MQIIVRGSSERVSRKVVREAIEFFAERLMTERLHSSLKVQVSFVSDKEIDCASDCAPDYIESTIRPKTFELRIRNKLPLMTTIQSLAHEMVHIKQYARAELFDYFRKPLCRWRGRFYDKESMDTETDAYWLAPWEIEARGYEEGLYNLFVKRMKAKGIHPFKAME